MLEEEKPFHISDIGEALVRIATAEIQFQTGIVGCFFHQPGNGALQFPNFEFCLHIGDVFTVHGLHNAVFEIDRESFIQPEIVPVGIGYQVAAPTVGEFMCYE